jgi:hypothetical protein
VLKFIIAKTLIAAITIKISKKIAINFDLIVCIWNH